MVLPAVERTLQRATNYRPRSTSRRVSSKRRTSSLQRGPPAAAGHLEPPLPHVRAHAPSNLTLLLSSLQATPGDTHRHGAANGGADVARRAAAGLQGVWRRCDAAGAPPRCVVLSRHALLPRERLLGSCRRAAGAAAAAGCRWHARAGAVWQAACRSSTDGATARRLLHLTPLCFLQLEAEALDESTKQLGLLVVAFDRSGVGLSDGRWWGSGLRRTADDAAQLAGHLGLQRLIVIGCSGARLVAFVLSSSESGWRLVVSNARCRAVRPCAASLPRPRPPGAASPPLPAQVAAPSRRPSPACTHSAALF